MRRIQSNPHHIHHSPAAVAMPCPVTPGVNCEGTVHASLDATSMARCLRLHCHRRTPHTPSTVSGTQLTYVHAGALIGSFVEQARTRSRTCHVACMAELIAARRRRSTCTAAPPHTFPHLPRAGEEGAAIHSESSAMGVSLRCHYSGKMGSSISKGQRQRRREQMSRRRQNVSTLSQDMVEAVSQLTHNAVRRRSSQGACGVGGGGGGDARISLDALDIDHRACTGLRHC